MAERRSYIDRVRAIPLDPGTLVALLLSIPAIFPLLKGGYFISHDGLFHLYRLVGLDRALHQGLLHPLSSPLCHFLDDEGDLDISPILGDTAALDNRCLAY